VYVCTRERQKERERDREREKRSDKGKQGGRNPINTHHAHTHTHTYIQGLRAMKDDDDEGALNHFSSAEQTLAGIAYQNRQSHIKIDLSYVKKELLRLAYLQV
jgi:hypothetical protein